MNKYSSFVLKFIGHANIRNENSIIKETLSFVHLFYNK